jgi:hypothetical protein
VQNLFKKNKGDVKHFFKAGVKNSVKKHKPKTYSWFIPAGHSIFA